MRIIGGTFGGRRLKSIEAPGLRPTTDRVRESVFNILESRIEIERAHVLDLFAGTGALGIEALSRGAAHCHFVESNRRAVAVIHENLQDLGLADRALVLHRDALRHIHATDAVYDLMFADPPYAATVFDRLVHDIFSQGRLSSGGLLVLEHSGFMKGRATDLFEVVTERSFGDTGVTIFRARSAYAGGE